MNNENPFGRSFACGAILFATIIALLYGTGQTEGDMTFRAGYIAANVGIPSIVTAFWAANSDKTWAWWRYGLTVFGLCIAFVLVRVLPKIAQVAH